LSARSWVATALLYSVARHRFETLITFFPFELCWFATVRRSPHQDRTP